MSIIVEKKYLEKFFRLYSKCSRLYSDLLNLEKYLTISYYKSKDNFIYSYEYIDFVLLYCHQSGEQDVSHNPFLAPKFFVCMHFFMANEYSEVYEQLHILRGIHVKIKNEFKDDLTQKDILQLNDVYRKALSEV